MRWMDRAQPRITRRTAGTYLDTDIIMRQIKAPYYFKVSVVEGESSASVSVPGMEPKPAIPYASLY